MKRVILLALGFFPLLSFGLYMDYLISYVYLYEAGPYFLFGVVTLAVWFVMSMVSRVFIGSTKEVVICLCAPAFLLLIASLVQEFTIVHFQLYSVTLVRLFNAFYLPLMRFVTVINSMFGWLNRVSIIGIMQLHNVFVMSFMSLFVMSYLGCFVVERRKKDNHSNYIVS